MSNEWAYVIVSYAITWLALIGYATYIARRARRANSDAGAPS